MSGKSVTGIVLACTVGLLVLYDIFAASYFGTEATISYVTYEWAVAYPVVAFAAGMLAGHTFWTQRGIK